MQRPLHDRPTEPRVSAHILPTAATMVGVCMTVLSIGRLGRSGRAGMLIDKTLAADAVLFLASAVLSFGAIRAPGGGARQERWAELVFLAALAVLVVAALALAFAIDIA